MPAFQRGAGCFSTGPHCYPDCDSCPYDCSNGDTIPCTNCDSCTDCDDLQLAIANAVTDAFPGHPFTISDTNPAA